MFKPERVVRVAVIAACLMCATSLLALIVAPDPQAPSGAPAIDLESAIPRRFGDWREAPARAVQVVNPQAQAMLDRLYSQLLSRTYVDSRGYAVMLSLAYGDDQRGGLRAHMPDVCYPAQGFQLLDKQASQLETHGGAIQVQRLKTQQGTRVEPVTYWFALADRVVSGRFEQRWTEIKLALTGQIPHGLLFRVSSIDTDAATAFLEQDRFVRDLLGAMPEAERRRISGLIAAAP
jgi:EpsI family protein